MLQPPSDSVAVLNARSQALLIDFLNGDLDLAFTFLQTAAIEAGSDDAHATSAILKAEAALQTVRYFQSRIESPDEWNRINERAAKLEASLGDFSKLPLTG